MVRLSNIKVGLDFDFGSLKTFASKITGLPESGLTEVKLAKKSVDARKRTDVHFVISLDITSVFESKLLQRKDATAVVEYSYEHGKVSQCNSRPVVVGFGPAGIFAALILAVSGAKPIVLERGADVDTRRNAVEKFWLTGQLDEECNVQFGEGGAGTFSDGKLTTGTKDKRLKYVLLTLVEHGAPEEILYLAKPHIGTDKLRIVVKNIREYIVKLGGEIHFNSKLCGIDISCDTVKSVKYVKNGENQSIITDNVILAIGHSARDTFEMLYDAKLKMSQKSFSLGVRIEHLQSDIDRSLYGDFSEHHALGSADYKAAVHLPDGRSVYTFCMCPGGFVVAAASENGRLAVNGMSNYARDGENANSAVLVGISPSDFADSHPLAGIRLQRDVEERAFMAGGGGFKAPVALVGDFLSRRKSTGFGRVKPTYKPGTQFVELDEYFPDYICNSLRQGIIMLGKKIRGFNAHDAVLTGVESRSSSPVRIDRNEDLQSVSCSGIFPCGEGAGYAGGIVSAAVDGIKCAEKVLERMCKISNES